jgi:hypothetical protein
MRFQCPRTHNEVIWVLSSCSKEKGESCGEFLIKKTGAEKVIVKYMSTNNNFIHGNNTQQQKIIIKKECDEFRQRKHHRADIENFLQKQTFVIII